MTISSASRKAGPFLGNGVTASFPFLFKVFQASDLQVIKTGVAGTDAVLTLNSDYSVVLNADQNASPGGTITYPLSGTKLATGEKLTATGVLATLQGTHITNGGNFFANNIEDQMDYLTILTQQLVEQTSRALLGSTTDAAPVLSLGTAAQRAGKFVAFDVNGNISLSVTLPSGTLSQASIAGFLNPQNSAEAAKGIVPVNLLYPAQTGIRYANNTVPGTTPMNAAIQAAIDSATGGSATVLIADQNVLSAPLLIRATTQESIGLYGNARVVTELVPNAASIATGPVNINALIINQNSNAHLHLTHLRSADSNFTGYFMYAVPGGGADSSCKPSFSTVVEDCWFSPSSNGSGVFAGYYSNMQMSNCVFESTKAGCIRMMAGNIGPSSGSSSDIIAANVTMNGCFDAFLLGTDDTYLKAILTVDGLHAYGHLRGQLFQIINGVGLHFSNVTCEADVTQINTVGLFSLQDCAEVNLHDMICHSRSGVPQGAGPNAIINGFTGTITNVIADTGIGLQFTGAGVLNGTFENNDFSGGNLPLQFITSTQTGQLIFRGCRFNNAQNECFSGGVATNIDFYNCEFLNAGLNGTAANNNVDLALSGGVTINFIRCKFGQNSGSAAAGSFFKFTGTGTVNIIDPIMVGVAPTSLVNAGSTLAINWDGINSNTPGFTQFVPTVGGTATYTTQYFNWSLKGKVVTLSGRLTINTIGTGSANTISGLPFTSSATNYGSGTIPFFGGSAVTLTSLGFTVNPGSNSMTLRGLTAAAAATSNPSAITSGTDMIFEGAYPL